MIGDEIVFINGEKKDPLIIEGNIDSRDEVNAALIIDVCRLHSGLLLETKQPPLSEAEATRL